MAKIKSIFNVEGTIGELTFFKDQDGYKIRQKGGVSKERILNDPNFARTRENLSEFGHSAKMGKVFREAINSFIKSAKDCRVTSRVTQMMARVKNEDLTSQAGSRNVPTGIQTAAGKAWMAAFEFNKDAPLSTVLKAAWTLDTATGTIDIPALIPTTDLGIPEGATHVTFSGVFMNLDFETKVADVQATNEVNLPINGTETAVTLTPAAVPTGTGQSFYLLKVQFFRNINGFQSPLNNGAFNALQLVEVL